MWLARCEWCDQEVRWLQLKFEILDSELKQTKKFVDRNFVDLIPNLHFRKSLQRAVSNLRKPVRSQPVRSLKWNKI
jgi:hypothetical protein